MSPPTPDQDAVTLAPPGNPGGGSGFRWPAERREQPEPSAPPREPRDWKDWARIALVGGGGLAAVVTYFAPAPEGLSAAGKSAFAVFLLCTTLWVGNALPVGITGLLAIALLGLTGAMTPSEAFAAFGSSAVFFILGVFILAAALIRSGLSKRIALAFLSRFGRSPYRLATGMMLTSALLTVFSVAPVGTWVMVTVALATLAPLSSVTTPRMAPVVSCA